MSTEQPARWTRPEAADHLRCSVSSVIRYESQGLDSHRIGPRMIRLWAADVIAFKNTSNPTSKKREKTKRPGK